MPSGITTNSRILVADDDRLVLSTLCMGLTRAGYQVEAVDSGEAAINACNSQVPDLVVVDYNMPGMSGLEVARHIRDHAGVPVLMLTAYDDIELIQEAAQCGINGYFVKPIDSSQLIPSIELNLKSRSHGGEKTPHHELIANRISGPVKPDRSPQSRLSGKTAPDKPSHVTESAASFRKGNPEEILLIQHALDHDRIDLVFQPIVEIGSGRTSHYEALLRLLDEKGRHITPDRFLETAERSGLIRSLDHEVLARVIKIMTSAGDSPDKHCISLNMSGVHFGNPVLLQSIRDSINNGDVAPESLIFEVTETAAMQDLDQARKFILELKSLGCRFALDDFGTGYASFHYLRVLPVDFIKIDGTFIRELEKTEQDRLFIKAMVDVARGLGIKSIAEYVSNQKTLEILEDCGVDYAQGYFTGKPGPLPRITSTNSTDE